MTKTWQKGSALLLVGVMIVSSLVALISAPVATADSFIPGTSDRFEVDFIDTWMEDELIFDVDPNDNSYYLLGEGDGVADNTANTNFLDVNIDCENAWQITNVLVNITGYDDTVFDFNDLDDTEPDWPSDTGWWNTGGVNGSTQNFGFWFDVLKTSGLGAATDTTIDMRIVYYESGTKRSEDFTIQIYLSSIFDNPATQEHEMLPNMLDASGGGDDARFEAGDSFEPATLNLHNYDNDDITDVTCTVTPPSPITFSNNVDYCTIPAGITAGGNVNANYRVNVPAGTAPDIYMGTASITYTRDDGDGELTVTETGRELDFEVDFNFRDEDPVSPNTADTDISEFQVTTTGVQIVEEVPANGTRLYENAQPPYDPPTIDQSTYTDEIVMIEITLTNNGNHPLYNVEFQIDPTVGPWDYFRNPQFFWAENGVDYVDDLTLFVDLLPVGDDATFVVSLIVANDIPIGEHRLPISYTGYWFNDGALDEATGFFDINGGTDLFAVFSIFVVDEEIACHAVVGPVNADDKTDITANDITVEIFNDEGYNFIDVMVQADFTGTPWYDPIIGMGGTQIWANEASPAIPWDNWDAGDSFDAVFTVDTLPDPVPDRYPFILTITAVIEETLEEVTTTIDYTRGAVIDFTGYGAELLVTGFTSDDIVPGEEFQVTFDITNVGDDTARDLFVFVPVDDTSEYDWYLEREFKRQFDWTAVFENWFDVSGPIEIPEDMFYTVEDLDVDNIREIIEINLYMDGVYSDPGAVIGVVHITDLAPGATTNATFTMIADKDMVNGKPYVISVSIDGIDSEGSGNIAVQDTFNIEIMSSLPGETYNPVELDWFDAGIKALALLLFLIIIFAILMMVLSRFKGEDDYDDDDDFGFDDEDEEEFAFEPKEEPEAPAEAPEELVEP